MKKPILISLTALSITITTHAQTSFTGTVVLANDNANPAATLASSTFGLVFVGTANNPIPLNRDINLTFLGGNSVGSLSQIATLTFANGRAQGDYTTLQIPGQFLDLTGNVYGVPSFASTSPTGLSAFFDVQAWLGNDTTYAAALADGSATGTSGIFEGPAGGLVNPVPFPPASIGDGMPSFLVTTPEPTTLALCGLGAASLLLLRRKKQPFQCS
jgi:hypothetical protein